jgi:hypothetical protein
MAHDLKYGKVTTERGDIGENEPVIVFRAQDVLLPKLLAYYHLFCLRAGSPRRHLDLILDSRETVEAWQEVHHTQIPRSDGFEQKDR